MIEEVRIKDESFSRSQALSIGLHTTLVVVLLFPFAAAYTWKTKAPGYPIIVSIFSPPPEILRKLTGSSGGQRQPGEVTRGLAPQKNVMQIVPPGPQRNPLARLQMVPTIVAPPDFDLRKVIAERWGDPFAKNVTDAGGPGGPDGFGTKRGKNIGNEDGDDGVGRNGPGREPGYTDPTCSYCPNPTFTDEAIKAKYQGRVLLRVLVSAEGRADRIQVVASAGMGLDERALDAVRAWRFRPGRDPAGQPSPALVYIEVHFRQF